MSFSKDTKKELCTAPIDGDDQMRAVTYGMALFSKSFSASRIALTTECHDAAAFYSECISSFTSAIVDTNVTLTRKGGDGRMYNINIPDTGDCERIFELFGHSRNALNLRVNRSNIDEEDCLAPFLRGAFLVCGNVTDPEKDYHLEFSVTHMKLAADLSRVISETGLVKGEPGSVRRKGSYIVYIKESDTIADMLTYMGAPMSALEIMQRRIYKSVRNKVNRQINSETANSNKTALASAKQVAAIRKIEKLRGLEYLSDDLRELAALRLENPEYNLRELGEALSSPISRSGVNHRLMRIIEIANGLSDQVQP